MSDTKQTKKVEPTVTADRNLRKTRQGIVVSTSMEKTIVVSVRDSKKHFYGKIVKTEKRFKAHDEKGEAGIGDVVQIMETRPLSKTKRFRLVKIVEKAK